LLSIELAVFEVAQFKEDYKALEQKIKTEEDGVAQSKWRPRKLFNYIQDFDLKPDVIVDVTEFIDKKIEMVMQFKSQFYDPNSTEENTPISSPDFIANLKGRARAHGRRIGVQYGEGFTCVNYIGTQDLMKIL